MRLTDFKTTIVEKMIDRLGQEGKLYRNPTREEFSAIITDGAMQFRMLLDADTGDLYVWDAYYATHGAVKDRFVPTGIHIMYELLKPRTIRVLTLWRYERLGFSEEQVQSLVANNPYLKRLVPDMRVEIEP